MSDVAATAIDVSRLPRSPGSVLEVAREIPAPADLSVAMARVAPESPIDIDISLESVVEGIWMSGTADVDVTAECSRCLDPIEWAETVELEQLFVYPATDASGAIVRGATDDDATGATGDIEEPEPEVHDDTIDIEGPLRDAVVLSLPLAPLCSPDCAGICPQCGERLESLDTPHDHPDTDPRWAALEALLEDAGKGASEDDQER
jgi:uncharacterized protein